MDLVRYAHTGDRAAFDALAHRYRPLLYALAFLRTGQREEAEDLVQEVLIRAWRSLPELQEAALFLPWLKAIMANTCISWYRRARVRPDASPGELDHLVSEEGLPLETVLERERQRRLQQALLTLPEANRLALLMHAWDGSSYEEIAAFTGVLVTTVEGRIYRARRQLRRLLQPAAESLLDRIRLPRKIQSDQAINDRQGRKSMTPTQTATPLSEPSQPAALAVFTRLFSILLDMGLTLVRILESLEESPEPYGEVAKELKEKVLEGHTVSSLMAQHPDLFPPVYVALVRAGEIGGVLEEAMLRIVKVMNREWELASRSPQQEEPLFLLHPVSRPRPGSWAEMPAYHRTITLSLFFESFGMLLQSGVPIDMARKTITPLLPAAQQEEWNHALQEATADRPLSPVMARMGIFPQYALETIVLGEETGKLEIFSQRLAEVFEDQMLYGGI